jgi:hypothetical protein
MRVTVVWDFKGVLDWDIGVEAIAPCAMGEKRIGLFAVAEDVEDGRE